MAYSTVNLVARSPIDELVAEISSLLHSSEIDSAYDKYQVLTEKLSFEMELSSKTLEDIRKLNSYFLKYIESSKNGFPKILSHIDSLVSRANLLIEEKKIEGAKKIFLSFQSYYEKIPYFLYDEKMMLHDRLSTLKKDIISKTNDIMQASVKGVEIKFDSLKDELSKALSQGSINEAQRTLSLMINLHNSLAKSQNLLRMRLHREILLFQYELGFARNIEYNSEKLDSKNYNEQKSGEDNSVNLAFNHTNNPNLDKLKSILKNIPKIVNPIYSSEPENPELIFDDPDEASIDEIPRIAADYDAKQAFDASSKVIREELLKKGDYDVEPYEKNNYSNTVEESQDVYAALKEDNPQNPLFNYVSPILENTFIKKKFEYDERLSFAIDAYNGKDYIKAKELFEEVLKESPDNVKAQQMVSVLNDLVSIDV